MGPSEPAPPSLDRFRCCATRLLAALLISAGLIGGGVAVAALVGATVVVASTNLASLLGQLRLADQSWRPRAMPLPDGGIRYLYKRRADDPLLSVAQIKERLRNPPDFELELRAIARLIPALERLGVLVVLTPPIKRGAAAEWDPTARTIRIQPSVVGNGSAEFARVLNHEAIHVAQSCRRGGLAALPKLLGLSTELNAQGQRHLGDPVYAGASPLERALEREAYANQHNLELAIALLANECRQRR